MAVPAVVQVLLACEVPGLPMEQELHLAALPPLCSKDSGAVAQGSLGCSLWGRVGSQPLSRFLGYSELCMILLVGEVTYGLWDRYPKS